MCGLLEIQKKWCSVITHVLSTDILMKTAASKHLCRTPRLRPRQVPVGTVSSHTNCLATITLPGGGVVVAKASAATVGQQVFVQNGMLHGQATNLTLELIGI
jgi:hypothetical protein